MVLSNPTLMSMAEVEQWWSAGKVLQIGEENEIKWMSKSFKYMVGEMLKEREQQEGVSGCDGRG